MDQAPHEQNVDRGWLVMIEKLTCFPTSRHNLESKEQSRFGSHPAPLVAQVADAVP